MLITVLLIRTGFDNVKIRTVDKLVTPWCYHFWLISQSHHQQGTLLLHSSVTIWSSFVNLNGHTEKQSD
jgi:hypothetical protein